jgi:molecular chaperone GrpE (heat shock protein)
VVRAALAASLVGLRPAASQAEDGPPDGLDVVLLLDTSESMQGIGTESILDFADSFRPSQRLGVVTFGEQPEVVHPLSSAVADAERGRLKKAVGRLRFVHEFKDFPGGLELALRHLATEGRADAHRVVILLSSGELVPDHGYRSHEDVLAVLRDHVLYEYYLEEIPVYAVAFGRGADLPVMREIGASTRGKTLVAPDATSLDDLLSVMLHGIQPPRTHKDVQLALQARPEQGPSPPRRPAASPPPAPPVELTWILAVFVALLLVINALVLVLLAVNAGRMKAALRRDETDAAACEEELVAPQFTSLRKKVSDVGSLLEEARAGIEGFQVDLEDFGAESWEREKDLEKRFDDLTDGVFLLLDHLEVERRNGAATIEIEWTEKRARELLSQEGIREIPVREGDEYDGMYHKRVGDRSHKTPAGTILEVARRGYYIPRHGDGEDDVILRHAEVVVSSGDKRG